MLTVDWERFQLSSEKTQMAKLTTRTRPAVSTSKAPSASLRAAAAKGKQRRSSGGGRSRRGPYAGVTSGESGGGGGGGGDYDF